MTFEQRSENVGKLYDSLYRRLKADVPLLLDERRKETADKLRESIIQSVRLLPHPSVASIIDIIEVSNDCIRGKLELFYRQFGEEATHLRSQATLLVPEEKTTTMEAHLAPTSFESLRDLGAALMWTNRGIGSVQRGISGISGQIFGISGQVDIVLKGQCPFCGGDLIEIIDGKANELRVMCKNYQNCREWKSTNKPPQWMVSSVTRRQ